MFLKSKSDYQSKLFDIINPLLPHYSVGRARLTLGFTGASYTQTVAEMEGFARVLWGLAPYLAGGGKSEEFEAIYLQGLAHGSDPQNPEYWGDFKDRDQRLVEVAAIAVGLLLAPDKLWTPLSQEEKNNLAKWISNVNAHELVPNNWQFFGVLANVALKKLGRNEFSQNGMDRCLQTIDSMYEGDGWYRDGPMQTHDYYVAFAMHYYGLIYSVFMEKDDPDNAKKFKDRAMLFGPQFVYWFDETGAAIPYGRSLTYRFAEVAFFSACIFAGIEPVSMPVMKGIIDRNLQLWWQKSHMQNFSGILTIGYEYPNLIMAEAYNAPGSPLWALKAFLLLALKDSHPYWATNAAEFPRLEDRREFPQADMVITHQRGTGAIMYPTGVHLMPVIMGHIEEKYSKFAYSSKFGFSVHKENDCLENMAPDSDLVFQIGGKFFGRSKIDKASIDDCEITSQWSPFPGVDVTTTITPNPLGHSRRHIIKSSVECIAYDCGFSMPIDDPDYSYETDGNSAQIRISLGSCTVYTYTNSGSTEKKGVIVRGSPNTNLLFQRSAMPAVSHNISKGTTEFITTVIVTP